MTDKLHALKTEKATQEVVLAATMQEIDALKANAEEEVDKKVKTCITALYIDLKGQMEEKLQARL